MATLIHGLTRKANIALTAAIGMVGLWDLVQGNLTGAVMCVGGVLVGLVVLVWSRWNG